MDELRGNVFDIQRFSTHDGPGIRTTVFMKGCPLRCKWCHNPEGLSSEIQMAFFQGRCTGCGLCASVCTQGARTPKDGIYALDRNKCTACGHCVPMCTNQAMTRHGESMCVYDVLLEVDGDAAFYRTSGGGVTLSGGEALLQADFSASLMAACKSRGYDTALETCGHVPWTAFEKVLPHCDLFLYDLKAITPELHKAGTGVNNARILNNLHKLVNADAHVVVRIPVIPGFQDADELDAMARLVSDLGTPYELLGYHRMAEGKYHSLRLHSAMHHLEALSADCLEATRLRFHDVVSGGKGH